MAEMLVRPLAAAVLLSAAALSPSIHAAPTSSASTAPPVLAPGCHGREEAASGRLARRVRDARLYQSWSKPGCLDYLVDQCDLAFVDVSIHEHHDGRCGGDPYTGPMVDSFRVYRRGTRIDWFNVVDAVYRPFDKIHSEGHR
jgi:hypothetical protein